MQQEKVTPAELAERQYRVAMKDPKHLKEWLEATDRRWLVFDGLDLVDSLPFPNGIDDLMRVVACYLGYRSRKPSGRVEIQKDPTLKKKIEVPVMKTDQLEIEELDRCIRHLVKLATTKDPTWTLENLPL